MQTEILSSQELLSHSSLAARTKGVHCLPHWSELMDKSLQGDKAAYSRLLREFNMWLDGYFTSQEYDGSRSKLIQDILLTVHRKLATGGQSPSVLNWLLAIADYRIAHPNLVDQ